MGPRWLKTFAVIAAAIGTALVAVGNTDRDRSGELINVSYDPTRELFTDLNRQFSAKYQNDTGQRITVKQSHGGSSRQARAVVGGLQEDVVTLALFSDVDALRKQGLLVADGWQSRLPNNSASWSSTIVFVVRKRNPLGIHDWPDLLGPGVAIITPNPKTSGNGKLSLLAAWGSVINRGGNEIQTRDFLRRLYGRVSVLDVGARSSAVTFADEKEGAVHLTWENEAIREVDDSKGGLEIVYPPISILAEPGVAWVDGDVTRRKTASAAKAYLEFLYTAPAQEPIFDVIYKQKTKS